MHLSSIIIVIIKIFVHIIIVRSKVRTMDECVEEPFVLSIKESGCSLQITKSGIESVSIISARSSLSYPYLTHPAQITLVLNNNKTHLLVMASAQRNRKYGNFGVTIDTDSEIIEPIHS